jgi:hypothetical protein
LPTVFDDSKGDPHETELLAPLGRRAYFLIRSERQTAGGIINHTHIAAPESLHVSATLLVIDPNERVHVIGWFYFDAWTEMNCPCALPIVSVRQLRRFFQTARRGICKMLFFSRQAATRRPS